MFKDFLQIVSSGSMMLLTITLKNISRLVVGNVLMNISPSTTLFPARFHQNSKALLGLKVELCSVLIPLAGQPP